MLYAKYRRAYIEIRVVTTLRRLAPLHPNLENIVFHFLDKITDARLDSLLCSTPSLRRLDFRFSDQVTDRSLRALQNVSHPIISQGICTNLPPAGTNPDSVKVFERLRLSNGILMLKKDVL